MGNGAGAVPSPSGSFDVGDEQPDGPAFEESAGLRGRSLAWRSVRSSASWPRVSSMTPRMSASSSTISTRGRTTVLVSVYTVVADIENPHSRSEPRGASHLHSQSKRNVRGYTFQTVRGADPTCAAHASAAWAMGGSLVSTAATGSRTTAMGTDCRGGFRACSGCRPLAPNPAQALLASPRPLRRRPAGWELKNGSNARRRMESSIPTPSSETVKATRPLIESNAALIWTRPPCCWVASRALSIISVRAEATCFAIHRSSVGLVGHSCLNGPIGGIG